MKNISKISAINAKFHPSWAILLDQEFNKPYMKSLLLFLESEHEKGKIIYPPIPNWFEVLKTTAFHEVKAVIIGQDPYHGEGQAHGLSFSVKQAKIIPPSLRNIHEELLNDLKVPTPTHGNLASWSKQGVLLLNTVLTVEKSSPRSHQGVGWEIFTNKIIEELSKKKQNLVFFLWGNDAQKKSSLIDKKRHLILEAPHPSPLSAYKGFLGCKHFSLANKYIYEHKKNQIDWTLPANDQRSYPQKP